MRSGRFSCTEVGLRFQRTNNDVWRRVTGGFSGEGLGSDNSGVDWDWTGMKEMYLLVEACREKIIMAHAQPGHSRELEDRKFCSKLPRFSHHHSQPCW